MKIGAGAECREIQISKFSEFLIYIKAFIHLLLHNLNDVTANILARKKYVHFVYKRIGMLVAYLVNMLV